MRQMFVMRVKEKEAELKEAEKDVSMELGGLGQGCDRKSPVGAAPQPAGGAHAAAGLQAGEQPSVPTLLY